MARSKKAEVEKPAPKKRAPRQPPASVLWQGRQLHSDLRFVFDLAEALSMVATPDETVISDAAQEEAAQYYKDHGINAVVDRVYDLHQQLIAQGRK